MTRVDLPQLARELKAAGVSFNGLGTYDGTLEGVHTWTDDPVLQDFVPLPPEAAPILAAHVPSIEVVPDFGDEGNVVNIQQQSAQIVQQMRAYLVLGTGGNPAPTNAQTVGVIKLLIRAVLVLIRVTLVKSDIPSILPIAIPKLWPTVHRPE